MAQYMEWYHTRDFGEDLANMIWADEAFTCLLVYYCSRYVGNSTLAAAQSIGERDVSWCEVFQTDK